MRLPRSTGPSRSIAPWPEYPPTRSLRRRDEPDPAFPATQRAGSAGCPGGAAPFALLVCAAIVAATLVAGAIHYIYFDRTNLPDLEAFSRFELPTIGHVYDVNGRPFIEMASEYREITRYEDVPPIVRGAILAAEDKNFFSHNGIDYSGFARVVCKLRIGNLLGRLTKMGSRDAANSAAIFPQGGSTITQQLVRGYFLKTMTAQEDSGQLRHSQSLARALSSRGRRANRQHAVSEAGGDPALVVGRRRDAGAFRFEASRQGRNPGPIRQPDLHGKRPVRVCEGGGILFWPASRHLHRGGCGQGGAAGGHREVGSLLRAQRQPNPRESFERRNQILALMAARGFISPDQAREASRRPIETVAQHKDKAIGASAVVDNVLDELKSRHADLSEKDLLQGHIQVYSTVDAGVQQIANQALEHGLLLYEKRHPRASGLIQGSVVVLRNRDASILAETGGRQFYKDRSSAYSDFNRVTKSLRQPGSAMKPIVYLAAFQKGTFNLDTTVPDEPISVSNGEDQDAKWISNYDGQFKGMIPLRMALAESRNAVAIWITEQIGIASVLKWRAIWGYETPLHPYATTALGASEVNLLELANAYRTIASGMLTQPHVIRKIVLRFGRGDRRWRTPVVSGRCRGRRALAHSGRSARCGAHTQRHGSRTGFRRSPVRGYGKDGNHKRVQGRALRGVHLRPRRNHRRRPNRL